MTGASSGIGEATVRALVAEGAAVVAGARRRERLEELVESVTHDDGKAIAVKCDVTDEEQAHDLVQRAVEEFGSIDILVNNAGIMLLSTVGKSLSDQWRAMFEVNVMGLLRNRRCYRVHEGAGLGTPRKHQQRGRAEGDPRLERGLRRDQARRERHLRGLTARAVGRQHPGVDRGTWGC